MRKRRKEVQALLGPDEYIFSLTAFPRMGCEGFTSPLVLPDPKNSVSRSLFWPDEAIFDGHPRFKTLTRNIRERRKEKVAINVPIYQDEHTVDPHEELVQKYGSITWLFECRFQSHDVQQSRDLVIALQIDSLK